MVLPALLLLAGCNITPTKAYEGPSKPLKELAVIKGGGSGDDMGMGYVSRVQLLAVDERRLGVNTLLASILPGRRTIGLSETTKLFKGVRTQYCAVTIEALAGCLYTPQPPSPPSYADAAQAGWAWSVDMPLYVECGSGGGAFQIRAPARCGSSVDLIGKDAR